MKYPNKEKKLALKKAAEEARAAQAEVYCRSDSFEEYAVKCAARGIRRKFALFGLVDPFWFYYKANDYGGMYRLVSCIALSLLLVGLAVFMTVHAVFSLPPGVTSYAGGAIGLCSWITSMEFVKNFCRRAHDLVCEEKCKHPDLDW